jgi:hypothetical protein
VLARPAGREGSPVVGRVAKLDCVGPFNNHNITHSIAASLSDARLLSPLLRLLEFSMIILFLGSGSGEGVRLTD